MRRRISWSLKVGALLIGSVDLALAPHVVAGEPADFDRSVAPLLAARCLDFHRGPKSNAGLDLSRRGGVREGGKGGAVVVAGNPDESLFWRRIESGEMPPKHPCDES